MFVLALDPDNRWCNLFLFVSDIMAMKNEESLCDLHDKMTRLDLGSGSSEVERSPTPSSLPDLLDEREATLTVGQAELMAEHLGESHLTTDEQL